MGRVKTNRVHQRVVRLSPEEAKIIDQKADESGQSAASYLRQTGLGKRIQTRSGAGSRFDIEMQKKIWRQVSGLGRNINQVAVFFHSGKKLKGGEKMHLELDEMRVEVQKLTKLIMELSCK